MWQLGEELHSAVGDVLAVAEVEVGDGGAGRGEPEKGDVTQLEAVGEVEFAERGLRGAVHEVADS